MTIPIDRALAGSAGLVLLTAGLWSATAVAAPSTTEPPTPPIAVEELTRSDEDTLARGAFTDPTGATLQFTPAGMNEIVIELDDLSTVAVARITVQPGAMFPWHTHPGPVIVNVVRGDFVYVRADDCVERPYSAGTGFVDPGVESVHTAFNPGDVDTVLIATFLQVPADGPLTITEGITAPDGNCGLPDSSAPHSISSGPTDCRPASAAPDEPVGSDAPPYPYFLQVAHSDEYGDILVDSECRGVYAFTEDSPFTPTCVDECAAVWPPLVVVNRSTTYFPDDFPVTGVEHPEGEQVQYGDWPLYTFAEDTAPGDLGGHGVDGFSLVRPDGTLVGADGDVVTATTEG